MKLIDDIIVLDTETEILCPHRGSKSSPFYSGNKIVYIGNMRADENNVQVATNYTTGSNASFDKRIEYVMSHRYLVGHNIKFDLLYLRKHFPDLYKEWYRSGGRVWDTMVVEYLLTGQDHTMPSLDSCSEKYGMPLKDNKIKEYWEDGITTSNIARGEIVPYLIQDVINTKNLFLLQVEQA